MSNGISWDDIGGGNSASGSSGKGNIFMRVEANKGYRIRPLGNPLPVWVYYNKVGDKNRRAITSIDNDKPETCVIRQKYNVEPKKRYAINVLNREELDENGVPRLMVLEAPITVFKSMKTYQEATGESPGGRDGADFFIKKDVPNGDYRKTTWEVQSVGKAPITETEHEMIKANNGLHNLGELFKVTPQEEIEQKLYGPEESSEPASSPAPSATQAAQAVGGTSSGGDFSDIF